MKITFTCLPCVENTILRERVVQASARGFPVISERERPPLAIVGGGPSLPQEIDALRSWPGDVWACGSPYPFLRDHGIEATFFNIDPLEETVDLARGAKHAILSTTNHPRVFDVVERLEVFDLDDYFVAVTSALSAVHVAMQGMGYTDITMFGSESSFEHSSHAYKHEDWEAIIFVKVGEETFATKPQLLMQAEILAAMIRAGSPFIKERSGGLLRAFVRAGSAEMNPDYDITHWNDAMQRLVNRESIRMTHPELGELFVVSPQERYEAMQRGYA